MTLSIDPNCTLQTARTFPYTPHQIYSAFANGKQLALWWGPNGFTNTFDVFEFTTGGQWQFHMHGPDGSDYYNDSQFGELIPDQKIVIEHLNAPRFTLTVSLAAIADGTDLIRTQTFETPEIADAVRAIAGPGNEQNLDRLFSVLKNSVAA